MANNIAKEYIEFSKKNIAKYLKIILAKYYSRAIVDPLLEEYINIRYYNSEDKKFKSLESNLNYYLKEKSKVLNEEADEETSFKIKKTFYLFKYILYLDNVIPYESLKEIVLEIDEYRNETLWLNDNSFAEDFYKLVKENETRKEKYLKSFNNEKFFIEAFQTSNKKVYKLKLNNTIKFNKIYSDYSKNKVYNEGIVNEQKILILYYLTSKLILENVIKGQFDENFIVDFPISIFEKEQKLNRLINVIDNELIKNNIIIRFKYNDYQLNKEKINTWIKEGFQVAVEIDDKYNYDEKSKIWLDIFKYIIIDKNKQNYFNQENIIIE